MIQVNDIVSINSMTPMSQRLFRARGVVRKIKGNYLFIDFIDTMDTIKEESTKHFLHDGCGTIKTQTGYYVHKDFVDRVGSIMNNKSFKFKIGE